MSSTVDKKRSELVKRLTEMIREPDEFPGGKLPPERELASELKVSRNLLREAIITLEAAGFLEIRERQGTFILEPGAEEFGGSLKFLALWSDEVLVHLMEARLAVESPAAAFAAERKTAEELARMRDCVAHLERVQGDLDEGLSSGAIWDSSLHGIIVNAAHNPVLSRLYEGLAATMERYIITSRTKIMALDAWPGTILEEHRAIVAAIAAGDGIGAEEAMRSHLTKALGQLRIIAAKKK